MEKSLNKSSEKNQFGYNEIIFVDVNSNFYEIKKKINQNDKLKKYLDGKNPRKKIFIPNKLINIII